MAQLALQGLLDQLVFDACRKARQLLHGAQLILTYWIMRCMGRLPFILISSTKSETVLDPTSAAWLATTC
ncbi:hypothetical protein D3C87_2018880 [compost metagenome]